MPDPDPEFVSISTTDGPTFAATSAAGSAAFGATGAAAVVVGLCEFAVVDGLDAFEFELATVVVAAAPSDDESFSTTFARPKPAAINAVAITAPSNVHNPRRSRDGGG